MADERHDKADPKVVGFFARVLNRHPDLMYTRAGAVIRPDAVGAGPEPYKGPRCHLCNETRRLSPEIIEVGGNKIRVCSTCAKQIEWDRAKRCVVCGEPSRRRLIKGVCIGCRGKGAHVLENMIWLIKQRWLGVIDEG
jgi:hypothetical protein